MKNKKILQIHSWLGLISGLFILIMGVTGSILVFHKEIDYQIEKEYLFVNINDEINIDKAIITVQNKYKNWDTRITSFNAKNEAIVFDLRKDNNTKRKKLFIHPTNGKIIKDIDANTHFTRWLLKLHYSLHLETVGKIIILIIGFLFFLSLITGLILYRKSIVKVLSFKVKLKRKNRRSFFSSIHRIVGVWSLLLNFLLVITGILMSYSVTVNAFKKPKEISHSIINISINQTLKNIKENHPTFYPEYIKLPTQENLPITIYGNFNDDFFLWSKYYNRIKIDNKKGGEITIIKNRDSSISNKFNSMIHNLHFGNYGGILVKILYSFIGISAPALSITGFCIWYYRKKPK